MPLPHKPPLSGYKQLSESQTHNFSTLSSKSVDIKAVEDKIPSPTTRYVWTYVQVQ